MLTSISKKYKEYINTAIHIAQKSCMRCKHGAVIIKNGQVVATGHNVSSSQCIYHNKYSIHAEVNAIYDFFTKNRIKYRNKKKILRDAFMIVIRIEKDGSLKNSKPCCECAKLICRYNIGTILYSVSDFDQYNKITKPEIIDTIDIYNGHYKMLSC